MDADRGPLEYLLRREFDCLGEHYNALPVNFSTGISLDRAPVVRDALAALSMGLQQTSVEAAVGLLRSRFVDLPDAGTPAAQRLVVRLFEAGREFLSTGDLRHAANDTAAEGGAGLALGRYLLEVSGMRELRKRARPSVWAQRFSSVLSVWGWPGGGPLDSLEFQQVELWYRTLEAFQGFDAVCGPLDYAAALSLLRDACSRQISQPQTADSRVQVLGPLEAAGLGFDQLWLCGLQGSSWPAPPRPNPLIPLHLQRRLQMPHATAEREWQFCEGLMRQYRRSAAVLHASYSRQLEGNPELPSSLLSDFTWETVPEPPAVDPAWTRQWQGRVVEHLADGAAPEVSGGQDGQPAGGSRLLEDQSQCPFRAFARHRLAVEPLGEFSVAQSAADRGSLLHDALYALWGEIPDHASLCGLDAAGESAAIEGAVHAALDAVPVGRRRSLGAAYWHLEALRLTGLLQEWLAVERQRAGFAVARREHDVTLALGQLQIRLRMDRIDELPDGSRLIIDYKSGRSSVADWQGDRPAKPQLLLYGLAAPESTVAIAVAQVRPRDSRFLGLGKVAAAPGVSTVEDWESLNARWRESLERLAAAFLSGDAAVDPLTGASCTWCGLQPLCRVAQGEQGP
jgi:probable DNA repair protein